MARSSMPLPCLQATTLWRTLMYRPWMRSHSLRHRVQSVPTVHQVALLQLIALQAPSETICMVLIILAAVSVQPAPTAQMRACQCQLFVTKALSALRAPSVRSPALVAPTVQIQVSMTLVVVQSAQQATTVHSWVKQLWIQPITSVIKDTTVRVVPIDLSPLMTRLVIDAQPVVIAQLAQAHPKIAPRVSMVPTWVPTIQVSASIASLASTA